MGMSAEQASRSIREMTTVLATSQRNERDITALQNQVSNLHYDMNYYARREEVYDLEDKTTSRDIILENKLYGEISAVIDKIDNLRSEMVERTEKPKRKGDLEISNQIEWDEEFLKIMNEPIIVDF